jgi:hypothetical protein
VAPVGTKTTQNQSVHELEMNYSSQTQNKETGYSHAQNSEVKVVKKVAVYSNQHLKVQIENKDSDSCYGDKELLKKKVQLKQMKALINETGHLSPKRAKKATKSAKDPEQRGDKPFTDHYRVTKSGINLQVYIQDTDGVKVNPGINTE